jgi:hypothetical protein
MAKLPVIDIKNPENIEYANLLKAIKTNNYSQAKKIVESGIDLDVVIDDGTEKKYTLLQHSVNTPNLTSQICKINRSNVLGLDEYIYLHGTISYAEKKIRKKIRLTTSHKSNKNPMAFFHLLLYNGAKMFRDCDRCDPYALYNICQTALKVGNVEAIIQILDGKIVHNGITIPIPKHHQITLDTELIKTPITKSWIDFLEKKNWLNTYFNLARNAKVDIISHAYHSGSDPHTFIKILKLLGNTDCFFRYITNIFHRINFSKDRIKSYDKYEKFVPIEIISAVLHNIVDECDETGRRKIKCVQLFLAEIARLLCNIAINISLIENNLCLAEKYWRIATDCYYLLRIHHNYIPSTIETIKYFENRLGNISSYVEKFFETNYNQLVNPDSCMNYRDILGILSPYNKAIAITMIFVRNVNISLLYHVPPEILIYIFRFLY